MPGNRARQAATRTRLQNRAPASALLPYERAPKRPPRATVAMAFALAAVVWASSWPGATWLTWLTARRRTPVATAPQICAIEKPEAPAPGGTKEGGAFSLLLNPHQTQPNEYVARVLMMVCGVSAAEAASLATQGGEVHVGTWERAIAEHAYAGMTAKGVLADLHPVHAHRGEALVAVRADGMALRHAAPELQADREVVLVAVKADGRALEHASEELRADREVVLAAVQRAGWALEHASPELRADREVVLAAVRRYGRALEYASEELRADREVVWAAVRQDGRARKHSTVTL